jgi:hypothetical protein
MSNHNVWRIWGHYIHISDIYLDLFQPNGVIDKSTLELFKTCVNKHEIYMLRSI